MRSVSRLSRLSPLSPLARAVALSIPLVLGACGDDDAAGTGGAGGDGSSTDTSSAADTTSTSNGTGGDGSDTGGGSSCADPTQGLFECDDASTCPELESHLGWTDAPDAQNCAGSLIDDEERGVLIATYAPGPGGHEDHYVIVVRGDGTAWVQVSHVDFSLGDEGTGCWTVDPILECDLVPECECAGEDACSCTWDPGGGINDDSRFVDCAVAAPQPTCDDVSDLLTED